MTGDDAALHHVPAGFSRSQPATPELRALLPSHMSTPSPPHSRNSRGDPSVSGSGSGAAGVLTGGYLVRSPLSGGIGMPPSSSSAPSSFSTPSSSAHTARRLVAPLSDPRRNSMLLLKQFAASLGPSQQLKLSKHSYTMGGRAGSAAQAAAVAQAKAQQAAQQQAFMQAATTARSPAGAPPIAAAAGVKSPAPLHTSTATQQVQWPGSPAPMVPTAAAASSLSTAASSSAVPAASPATAAVPSASTAAAAVLAPTPAVIPVAGGAVRHFSVTHAGGSAGSSRAGSRRASDQTAAAATHEGAAGSALLQQAAPQLNASPAPAK
jgi:hypothetical protein